jgi:uncharacterized protein YbjT (DUF2867 family)
MARSIADVPRLPPGVGALAVADFDDGSSLARALGGITAAYLVAPAGSAAERQQKRFIDAAVRAGVGRIVVLSRLGAAADSPARFLRSHAAAERHVRESGIPFTILRPNLFLQSLMAFQDSISSEGRFFAPVGAAPVSAVDVRDIGEVAAAALLDDGHEGRTYDLTGPEGLTHTEIAGILSDAVGRRVAFSDVAPATFAAELHGLLPAWQVDGLVEQYAHYRSGAAASVSGVIPAVTGRPARSAGRFARDYADEFRMRFA